MKIDLGPLERDKHEIVEQNFDNQSRQEDYFRSLMNSAPVGIVRFDAAGHHVFSNARFEELVGMSADQLRGDGWAVLVHPEDRDRMGQMWEKAQASLEPFRAECRYLLPNGETMWIVSEGTPTTDEHGTYNGFMCSVTDITERVDATQALERSEQRLDLVLRGTSVGIWDLDVVSGALYWSDRAYEIFGLSPSEFSPTVEAFRELVHEDDLELLNSDMSQRFGSGPELDEAYELEVRVRHADGHYMWLQYRGRAIWDDDGNVVRAAGSLDDITEKKEAIRALEQSEERLNLGLQGASVGLCDLDIARNDLYCSPLMLEMFGIKDPDFEMKPLGLMQRVHPEDIKDVEDAFRATIKGRDEFNVECRLRAEDGKYFWGNPRGKLIKGDNGMPQRVIGALVHIDARKQIETQLADSEERLHLALEGSSAGFFDTDMLSGEVYCSPLYLKLAGLDENCTTLTIDELMSNVHPEDRDIVQQDFEAHLAGSPEFNVEHRTRHQDGTYAWVNTRGQATFDETGKPTRMTGSAININDRKEAEIALEAARIEAQAANEAKGEFLATVSHEIRTPMNGVIGMAQLLADTELDDEQHSFVDIIRSSGRTLVTLINDILDVSKLEAGKLVLEDTIIAPEEIANDVIQLLQSQASTKGLSLDCTVGEQVPRAAKGDPTRLNQILFNLVGNAVKFTKSGSVQVDVNAESTGPGRQRLVFSVTDTGIGIPEKARQHLFEKFSQADSSTTREFGGTGLGLSISRQLVEIMGGEISVDSVEGEGSTFRFWIPLEEVEAGELPSGSRLTASAFEATRSIKILVAEDNVVNQMLIERLLEKIGHDVTVVENGVLAIDALERETFDLFLTDIHMPQMGGVEAAKLIKSRGDQLSEIPIVACTADAIADHQAEFRNAGMIASVSKPIDLADLVQALDSCFSEPIHRQLTDGVEAPNSLSEAPSKDQEAALDSLLDDIGD